jgi:putative endonuclease
MPEWSPEGIPSEDRGGLSQRDPFGRKPLTLLYYFFYLYYNLEDMFVVYILKSLKDGRFYYGQTEDLNHRLKLHNSGKVKATRHRRPLILHYFEEHPDRCHAAKREHFFKSINGYIFLKQSGII